MKPIKSEKKNIEKKEYTKEEIERISHYLKRLKHKPVKFKKVNDNKGIPELQPLGSDDFNRIKLMEALGTTDPDLQNYLISQVIQTFHGCVSIQGVDKGNIEAYVNIAMALLAGISPRDEIEVMIAVQMIGEHHLAMDTMKRAMITDQPFDGKIANLSQANKLARTFACLVEALKRYRTGGEQKVTVKHVHVHQGGQAIVGNVSSRGRGESSGKNLG